MRRKEEAPGWLGDEETRQAGVMAKHCNGAL